MEPSARSAAKALLYRTMSVIILMAISLNFTGDAGESSEISAVFAVVATGAYFVHERLWDSIKWGREGSPRSGATQ